MKIKKLDWDSTFFGLNVAEIEINSSDINLLEIENFDLVYIKSTDNFNFNNKNFRIGAEEEKVVFTKKIISDVINVNLPEPIKMIETIDYEINTLYKLAYESGKYSRFKVDNQIPDGKFEELYQLWIDNSINKTFADFFAVWYENKTILGFVTLKLHDNFGQIGLIAVAPNQQGKGIGTQLIKFVEEYCIKNKVAALKIPTQKQNIEACNFYHKLGYIITENTFIKHAWR